MKAEIPISAISNTYRGKQPSILRGKEAPIPRSCISTPWHILISFRFVSRSILAAKYYGNQGECSVTHPTPPYAR